MSGELIIEGKTKQIFSIAGCTQVRVVSKSDITAGDGAKRDSFVGKDVHATTTTVAVFKLLEACRISTAFVRELSPTAFIAERCAMLPYEVVVRRVALGSYLKRNPHVERGAEFPTLVVEFYLKTTDRTFKGIQFPKDDPLIWSFDQVGLVTYRPDMARHDALNPMVQVPAATIYGPGMTGHPMPLMERIARKVFLVLEAAWRDQGCKLADLKIEFGAAAGGDLLVADVIDNDSWRLFDAEGGHLDKQRYRDGADMNEVERLYGIVAQRVGRFSALHSRPTILLWRGSEKDDTRLFSDANERYGFPAVLQVWTGSVHKAPERSLQMFREELVRHAPNVVVIAFVGRSNGAGPIFAADTHVPVIAVPASAKEFPDDVWSSLRMPSDVPLMTVMDPANAIQAALGILSARSPHAYMARRTVLESLRLDDSNSPTFGK